MSFAPSCSCSRVPGCSKQTSAPTTSGRVAPPKRSRCIPRAQANAATKTHDLESVLFSSFKAHTKSLTAALILHDSVLDAQNSAHHHDEHPLYEAHRTRTPFVTDTRKEVITASLDKTMAFWRLKPGQQHPSIVQVLRLVPSGSPIFSFCKDGWNDWGDNRKQVFCGNMGREVLAWEPGDETVQESVVLDGHSGWVRALAKHKKWLFSASCNKLRQYDMTRAVPSLVREVTLDKGDILSLAAAGDRLFAAGADGSLWSWVIAKNGDLEETSHRPKAHGDRATVVRAHGTVLFSASYDGSVKMWDAATMELIEHVDKAHDGQRVTCLAVGPNGLVYTGGDDKLIRRWNRTDLRQFDPLYCHNHSIRTLNAGKTELLMAGDAGGEVSLWRV